MSVKQNYANYLKKETLQENIRDLFLPEERPIAHHHWVEEAKDTIDNLQSNGNEVFPGDQYMFIDGFIEYISNILEGLDSKKEIFPSDKEYNIRSGQLLQVMAGMNHISFLAGMDLNGKFDRFHIHIAKFLKTVDENGAMIEIIETLVNSSSYFALLAIRNKMAHDFTFPLFSYPIDTVLAYCIYVTTLIIAFFKNVLFLEDYQESAMSKIIREQSRKLESEKWVEIEKFLEDIKK